MRLNSMRKRFTTTSSPCAPMDLRRVAVLALAAFLLTSVGVAAFLRYHTQGGSTAGNCQSHYVKGEPIITQLNPTQVGLGETVYPLPAWRGPNGVAVAPDGSAWFGEESVPALAHLLLNGTLVEYPWPGQYPPPGASNYTCGLRTQIWGVALWDGRVWATDTAGNQLVGLNPTEDSFRFVTLPTRDAFPYSLTPSPDGDLWFTELFAPALGELTPSGSLSTFAVPTSEVGTPTQVRFINSSYAIYSDAGQAGEYNGGIFAFDPSNPEFARVGGDEPLTGITGLALSSDGYWVTEHGPPFVLRYDTERAEWTPYPTSAVAYSQSTLPYFIMSNGTEVWFNEHYGDRVARIDPSRGTMVEWSLSNPPADSLSGITGAQTVALAGSRVWFAGFSGDAVGLVDLPSPLPFTLVPESNTTASVAPGGSATFNFRVEGSPTSLRFNFTDSESELGKLSNLTASLEGGGVPPDSVITVRVAASQSLPDGTYTLDVTATDGAESYTVFVTITCGTVPKP
jgi:streptogramin lyase